MAIITRILPENVSLANRQPVILSVTSNAQVSEFQQNDLRILVSGLPQENQFLELSYGDFATRFTFSIQGEPGQLTLSTGGVLSLAEYADLLADELAAQVLVFLAFNINRGEENGAEFVSLTPRQSASFQWTTATDSPLTFQTVEDQENFPGTPGIVVATEIWDHADQEYSRRESHQQPVINTGEPVNFDLQSDFDLDYELPRPASIGPGDTLVKPCTRNWTKYKISYAETYGSPPVAQPLTSEAAEFYAVHGSRSFLNQYDRWWMFWASNGRFQTSRPSPVTVSIDQPYWLYWMGRLGNRDLQLRVTQTRRSGSVSTTNLATISETKGQFYAISCGFRQLGIADDFDDPVVSIGVQLIASVGPSSELYVLNISTACEEWDRYYLVGNSLGGYDCWWGKGRMTINGQVTTEVARRIVSANDIAEGRGEDFQYNRQQRVQYQGSIGYVSKSDINQLQNLLVTTSAIMIDTMRRRFVPILIDPGSIPLTKDGNDLEQLKFSFSMAYEDHAFGDNPKLY